MREIPLAGPAAEARAEISGMSWCGDHLILLPQYPMIYEDKNAPAYVFSISKSVLDDYFSRKTERAIQPDKLYFDFKGIDGQIPGFEGFEAIVFVQDHFFV